VDKLAFTPVRTSNQDASDLQLGQAGSQSELIEWTAQASAPVVAWNDERPRSLWNDQLYLAERLAPEPALIPSKPADRVLMCGLAKELMGEGGLLYHKRHFMVGSYVDGLPADSPQRAAVSSIPCPKTAARCVPTSAIPICTVPRMPPSNAP